MWRPIVFVVVCSVPLLLFTVSAFLRDDPDAGSSVAAVPRYEPNVDFVSGSAALLESRRGDVDSRDARGPAGWRDVDEGAADAELLVYGVARALAAGSAALSLEGDSAVGLVEQSLADVKSFLADSARSEVLKLEPAGAQLLASLSRSQDSLSARSAWLTNRGFVAESVVTLEGLLSSPPDESNERACLSKVGEIIRRMPVVVSGSDDANPGDARTEAEDMLLKSIEKRAKYRLAFLATGTAADPIDRFRMLEGFLADYPTVPDERDREFHDDAMRQFPVARLAAHKDLAVYAVDAGEFFLRLNDFRQSADALPRAQRAGAMGVTAEGLRELWLNKHLPLCDLPDSLVSVRNLQEANWIVGNATVRNLGLFQTIPAEQNRFRYWRDPQQRQNPDFLRGWHVVTLEVPPGVREPLLLSCVDNYSFARRSLLKTANFAETAAMEESLREFVSVCDTSSGALTELLTIDSAEGVARHMLQDDYDEFCEQMRVKLSVAKEIASDFLTEYQSLSGG